MYPQNLAKRQLAYVRRHCLGIVPRLVEDMISMPPDTLTLEEVREAQTRCYLRFMNNVVSVLRLVNDELSELWVVSKHTCVANWG